MEYRFNEPIKIVNYNPLTNEKNLYVFVGDVDKLLKPILLKLEPNEEPNVSSRKVLEKYYGARWKKSLGLNLFESTKHGGDDIDEIGDLLNLSDEPVPSPDVKFESATKRKKSKLENADAIHWVFDIEIYKFDKVRELKEKIYLATNIVPFKQFIWVEDAGKRINLGYTVLIDDEIVIPDIVDHVSKNNNIIENININIEWFNEKETVKIIDYEEFTLLNNTVIYLADFDALVHSVFLKESEMIYYGFVRFFFPMLCEYDIFNKLKNKNFFEYYPLLELDKKTLRQKYTQETKLLNMIENIDEANEKILKENMSISITSLIMTAVSDITDREISIRNIFDKFILTPSINFCTANLLHGNKLYNTSKKYIGEPELNIKEKLLPNSVMFNIKISTGETSSSFYLIILKNGTIIIKSWWREDLYYDFDNIYEIVKEAIVPIYDQVNKMNESVFGASKVKLPEFIKSNIKFSEIDNSLRWKSSLSDKDFSNLIETVGEFEKAKFIDKLSPNEFSFKKGMFQFDPLRLEKFININNYYSRYTNSIIRQKWDTLFGNMRKMTIMHRFSDVKIDIIGVKDMEYLYYFNLIRLLFYLYINHDGSAAAKQTVRKISTDEILAKRQKKTLNDLKERDPELYNAHKLYDTDFSYSKTCQKPFQPIMIDENEIQFMPKHIKESATKFINFTTHNPVYYYCPQKKYPWIRFITHKHPKGYCIPCCKITNAKETGAKKEIYDICMKTHIYLDEKKSSDIKKYIVSYGKPIEPGRLCSLPEGNIHSLLMSSTKLATQFTSCTTTNDTKYFIIGIPQNSKTKNSIGMLYCLSDALGMNYIEFMEGITKFVIENQYIINYTDLYYVSESINIIQELESMQSNINWNSVFITLAFFCYRINTILLEDVGGGNFYIRVPDLNLDRIFPKEYKNLLIVYNSEQKTYNPIYELNPDLFFKTRIISKKLFTYEDQSIIRIMSFIRKNMTKHNDIFNFDTLGAFLDSTTKYKINSIVLNKRSLCYLVKLDEAKTGKHLYIPIHESQIKGITHDINILKKFNYYGTYEMVAKFIGEYNKFATAQYPKLIIESAIMLRNKSTIGFIANGLNFYCTGTPPNVAKHKVVHFENPLEVNNSILMGYSPTRDWLTDNANYLINKVYVYRLFLSEVYYWAKGKKNKTTMNKIKILLSKANYKNSLEKIYDEIDELGISEIDNNRIKNIIKSTKGKNIYDVLDSTEFEFNDIIEQLHAKPREEVYKLLFKELQHLFTLSTKTTKDDTMNNIIASNKNKKLTITEKQYKTYIDYISYIITSKTLYKYIFSIIDINNVINFLDFEKRPTEILQIQ